MPNELPLGVRRVGDLIDFDADTPEVKVTLERRQGGICLTVPWSDPESPYSGWFVGDETWHGSRVGAERAAAKSVPRRLLFRDSHGSVLLIGCRARGFHANVFGPGNGTIWSKAALPGVDADLDFEQLNGLQTEISGLREWLGVTSWGLEYGWEDGGSSVTIRSSPAPIAEIGTFNGVTLSLRPSWLVVPEDGKDEVILRDLLRCTTRSDESRAWDEHLQLHRAIRDLLTLSRWRQESCVEALVHRADDPLTTLDGKQHGHQWRSVLVPDGESEAPPSAYQPHLIRFEDAGIVGLERWIQLRDRYARALDPILSSIVLRGATPHTLLANAAPGLEALGYLLMLGDGASARAAGNASLESRLARILSDVGECLPFDHEGWAHHAAATYNGLKHANRVATEEIDVANVWRESVIVIRAWTSLQLGVSAAEVGSRLNNDPQRHEYVRRT